MMKRAWNHYWLLCEISVCLLLLGILMTAPGGFMISRGGDGGIYLLHQLALLTVMVAPSGASTTSQPGAITCIGRGIAEA